MAKVDKRHGFTLDQARLEEICVAANRAWSQELIKYLPQWNLPSELDYYPVQDSPKEKLLAARYLWTISFFERMTRSRAIIRNGLGTWNSDNQWIFDPYEVKKRREEDVGDVLKENFQFNLHTSKEPKPAKSFQYNAQLLCDSYDGDPQKMVGGLEVSEARKRLMEFRGIGTGIANLFIIYLIDRKIAEPKDRENILLKVDVHKGRIPINCRAVEPTNSEISRDERFADVMEKAYLGACKNRGLDTSRTDAALWVIGSELCNRRDYAVCGNECPLFNMCKGYIPENKATGRYVVLTNRGRNDKRGNIKQMSFGFGAAPTKKPEE